MVDIQQIGVKSKEQKNLHKSSIESRAKEYGI